MDPLPAGAYQLELRRRLVNEPNNILVVGTLNFTVQPAPIPTLDRFGLALLIILIAALGVGTHFSRSS
jgi:hypothetical protein